jgi:hypothetical protein
VRVGGASVELTPGHAAFLAAGDDYRLGGTAVAFVACTG